MCGQALLTHTSNEIPSLPLLLHPDAALEVEKALHFAEEQKRTAAKLHNTRLYYISDVYITYYHINKRNFALAATRLRTALHSVQQLRDPVVRSTAATHTNHNAPVSVSSRSLTHFSCFECSTRPSCASPSRRSGWRVCGHTSPRCPPISTSRTSSTVNCAGEVCGADVLFNTQPRIQQHNATLASRLVPPEGLSVEHCSNLASLSTGRRTQHRGHRAQTKLRNDVLARQHDYRERPASLLALRQLRSADASDHATCAPPRDV